MVISEDQPALLENIKRKAMEMDRKKLKQLVNDFGTVGTRHTLEPVLE